MEIKATLLSGITNEKYLNCLSSLPENLQKRILKKKKEEDRKLSCIGYSQAATLYFETENQKAEFAFLPEGRPIFKNSDLYFSSSHSKDIVVTAVDNKNIGIDIEKVREINLDLVKKVCTQREEEYVKAANTILDQTIRFLEIWTAKEAYFKFCSTGIVNLKSVDCFSLSENIKRIEIPGYILSVYQED